MNFNDSASFSIKANDYRIQFWDLSLDEAVVLLKNTILTKKEKYKHKKIIKMYYHI